MNLVIWPTLVSTAGVIEPMSGPRYIEYAAENVSSAKTVCVIASFGLSL